MEKRKSMQKEGSKKDLRVSRKSCFQDKENIIKIKMELENHPQPQVEKK